MPSGLASLRAHGRIGLGNNDIAAKRRDRTMGSRGSRCDVEQLCIALLCAAVATAVGVPAFAQQTAGAGADGVDEIVVTARKREESLQDVPLAISALSAVELERARIESVADIAAATPGLTFQSFNAGGLGSPVIRGLSQTDIASPNNNVGVFLDGVYISSKNNIDLALLDLERVEVIKGPQSALYGRNTFAGAVNYVTRRPSRTFEGSVSATAGLDDLREGRFAVSGPLVADRLAARFAAGYSEFDGTLESGFGYENLGGWDRKLGAALTLEAAPTDRLGARLFAYHGETELDPAAGYIATNNCGVPTVATFQPFPRGGPNGTFFCGELAFQDRWFTSHFARNGEFETDFYFLEVSYDFGGARLSVVTSRGDYDFTGLSDQIYSSAADNNVTRRFVIPFVGPAEDRTLELRVQSTGDAPLRWLLGAFGFEGEFRQRATSFSPPALTLASGNGLTFSNTVQDTGEWAAFGSLEYELTPDLTGTVELRYNEEQITLWSGPITGNPTVTRLNETFSVVTPRATLSYSPGGRGTLYASYAEGAKSGGFNGTTFVPEQTFDPETNETFELGWKRDFAGARLAAAAFYIEWTDLQIPAPSRAPVPPGGVVRNVVQNVGEAEAYGLELELAGALREIFDYRLAVAWTQPEFVSGTIDFSSQTACPPGSRGCSLNVGGNRIPRSSEWQALASATWTWPLGGNELYLRGDVNHESEKFTNALNAQSYGERTLFNVRLGWVRNGLEVALWGRNLLDEEYIVSSINEPEFGRLPASTFSTAFPANTRTFGVTARYEFD
jgi:iron complex outermembrane receptor protein